MDGQLHPPQSYSIATEASPGGGPQLLVLQHSKAVGGNGTIRIPLDAGVEFLVNAMGILSWDPHLAQVFHQAAKECGLLKALLKIEDGTTGQ